MKCYAVTGPNASGTSNKTAVTIIAASTVRPRLYDLTLGNAQTPADQAVEMAVGRFTAVGTAASNPTPEPIDPNDAAALTTAGITHSAEPTYTSNKTLLNIRLNQRATFRWVASPGSELVAPATANNGIGVYLVSATAAMIVGASVLFCE